MFTGHGRHVLVDVSPVGILRSDCVEQVQFAILSALFFPFW